MSGDAVPVPGARRVWSATEVTAAIDRLAAALQPHVDAGPCVLLGVLLGGLFPLERIARRLTGDFELDACRVSRYGNATRGGSPRWLLEPQAVVRDRHVLLVDDIHDEGTTLGFVADHCRERGATRVTTAVLVRKLRAHAPAAVPADFWGLTVPDEYVFGCGMDWQGRFRHLDALWALPPGLAT
jgi:hypoxanthine phosphoribosyltransferase